MQALEVSAIGQRIDKPCNLCAARDPAPLFQKFGYDIVACRRCGLRYLPWLLSEADLEAFYGAGYFTGQADRKGYLDYAQDVDNYRKTFRHKLSILGNRPPGRLLDVGAAMGYFMEVAEAAGWETHGLEVSPYAAAEARRQGLRVVCGSSMACFESQRFDLVTMWDAVEHFNDPRQVLEQVHTLLVPGGRVVISTGDEGHALSRGLGRHARIYAPPQHLFYFSRQTLSALLERCGFVVESIRTDSKVVTSDYVLHIAQALVDAPWLERLVAGLRRVLPVGTFNLSLPDVMVVTAVKRS